MAAASQERRDQVSWRSARPLLRGLKDARSAHVLQDRGRGGGRGAGQGSHAAALVSAGQRRLRRARQDRRRRAACRGARRSRSPTSRTRICTRRSSTSASFARRSRRSRTSTRSTRSRTSCSSAATWRSSGKPEELDLGAQILKEVKAPVKMMVGEHDWYPRHGRAAGRSCSARRATPSTGRACTVVVLMSVHRERLLDRAQDDARGAHAHRGRARQRHAVALRGRRSGRAVAEERPGQGRATTRRSSCSRTRRSTNIIATGTSGPRTPTRCRRSCGRIKQRDGDARPHAPGAVQPHRQHPVPRHALDGVAVALCAVGAAGADRRR